MQVNNQLCFWVDIVGITEEKKKMQAYVSIVQMIKILEMKSIGYNIYGFKTVIYYVHNFDLIVHYSLFRPDANRRS